MRKQNNALVSEYAFSCEPIPEKDLRIFCSKYVSFSGFFQKSKIKKLYNALQEITKTPSGRMAFRACVYNILQQRKTNPNYHIKVKFVQGRSNIFGAVSTKNKNEITLFPQEIYQTIKEDYQYLGWDSTTNEFKRDVNFQIGLIFFHEAQHIRQLQHPAFNTKNMDKNLSDAPTQAFEKQAKIESGSRYMEKLIGLSATDKRNYQKAIDYNPQNGSFNPEKARFYSMRMQQRYAADFASSLQTTPYTNYTQLHIKWLYLKTNLIIAQILPDQYDLTPSPQTYEYLKTVNLIDIKEKTTLTKQGGPVLQKLGQQINDKCTQSDRFFLAEALCLEKQKLTRNGFSSDESYQLANTYFNHIKKLDNQFFKLAEYSKRLSLNPNNKEAQEKAKNIRTQLKNSYGIIMDSHNKSGTQIAHQNTFTNNAQQPNDDSRHINPNLQQTLAKNTSTVPHYEFTIPETKDRIV